jgi:hypothetical protein
MAYILLIILTIWLKAFGDAIRFSKVYEPCHILWHFSDWIRTYLIPAFLVYHFKLYHDLLLMICLLIASFSFNILYKMFKLMEVYRWDNRYLRIAWIEKILNSKGLL